MSSLAINFEQGGTITLVSVECYTCGVIFGLPSQLKRNLLDNHEMFYCPNGHGQSFIGKTEAQKLRELLEQEKQKFDREFVLRIKTEAREQELLKKQKRLVQRIARGVCPCCKRSFQNVKRHMEMKHSDVITLAQNNRKALSA